MLLLFMGRLERALGWSSGINEVIGRMGLDLILW